MGEVKFKKKVGLVFLLKTKKIALKLAILRFIIYRKLSFWAWIENLFNSKKLT